jgi:hypothetical protein
VQDTGDCKTKTESGAVQVVLFVCVCVCVYTHGVCACTCVPQAFVRDTGGTGQCKRSTESRACVNLQVRVYTRICSTCVCSSRRDFCCVGAVI